MDDAEHKELEAEVIRLRGLLGAVVPPLHGVMPTVVVSVDLPDGVNLKLMVNGVDVLLGTGD
jgi:hypothetical protein